jgi:integrase
LVDALQRKIKSRLTQHIPVIRGRKYDKREKKMRGSVYYQTSQLVKAIFKEGVKKEERLEIESEYYYGISSYQTMTTYRKVWNNFFNYLKEHWHLNDCERIKAEHVEAYVEYKIEYYPSKQYLEKISSALGALEIALNKYSCKKYEDVQIYNFNIRQSLLNKARDLKIVANNYVNRTYQSAEILIENLSKKEHRLAATIQLQGGARSEGVTLIKIDQLKGYRIDKISSIEVGAVETKEKGGKIGDVLISKDTYHQLIEYFQSNNTNIFKLSYQNYANDIRETAQKLGIQPKGSHGFRWTFAQNRIREYQKYGYTYDQALQGVSWEMKHFRANITEHYLG